MKACQKAVTPSLYIIYINHTNRFSATVVELKANKHILYSRQKEGTNIFKQTKSPFYSYLRAYLHCNMKRKGVTTEMCLAHLSPPI